MSIQMSLDLSVKFTSLPELGSGVTLSDKLDGATIEKSLAVPVRANPSRQLESSSDLTTPATSGPTCFGSSESYSLGSALASKLLQRGHLHGGILWRVTWSQRTTPQLRSISQVRVSVRRTSDRAYSGWGTPTVTEITRTAKGVEKRIPHRKNYHHGCLSEQVTLTSWPTPITDDTHTGSLKEAMMSTSKINRPSGHRVHAKLTNYALLTSWPTPTAMNQRSVLPAAAQKETDRLNGSAPLRVTVVHQLSGMMQDGYHAETENTGQLNPALARWLQGLPPMWDVAAIQASRTLKTRKKGG